VTDFNVPLLIRGQVIEDYSVKFGDRSATGRSFATPDVNKYLRQLINSRPDSLMDLYSISLEDIYDFLDALGARLDLASNPYWREAFEAGCHASNLSREVLRYCYQTAPAALSKANVRDVVESRIGSEFLEGWVAKRLSDGRIINVRAMGSRSIHIVAGNVPVVSIVTVLRGAITRNDMIIKAPSNDPLSANAIVRTMIDMAPDHPLTKHIAVAYWKGGDEELERRIYRAENLEKIVAWGGYSSIKHITKYIGPGIDLIALDPKSSTTLIGKEALRDESTMREVAVRVAADLGGWDQEACVNARVMFLESGTDPKGLERANRLGKMIFDAVQNLPQTTSNGPLRFDPGLKAEIQSIMPLKEFYNVITDPQRLEKTGAVIVSQTSEQVDFPKLLYGRVGNLVPLDDIEQAMTYFSAATQTVGIYPESLRRRLRDRAALMGGQVFQPIGYAITGSMAAPQDGIEPERRMCRWVVDNQFDPAVVPGPWVQPEALNKRPVLEPVA
jgi:hypothetical protein